jgi:hypothetical protein
VASYFGGLAAIAGLIVCFGGLVGTDLTVLLTVFTAAAACVVAAVPTAIDVGADGVMLTWFGRKTFIPIAQIASVRMETRTFNRSQSTSTALVLKDGRVVNLGVESRAAGDDRAETLAERIREAIDTASGGSVESTALLLGRADRSVTEWIRSLRAVGSGAAAGLRTAAIDPDHLWRVVESPAASGRDRAAAAVALAVAPHDEVKARLRVAADAVAEPKLRVVIDAAVEGNDEVIEEALGAITRER